MPAQFEPLFAQWLQGVPLWVTRAATDLVARWGDAASSTDRVTGLATRAAAVTEAERIATFLARGPFAIDVHHLLGTDWAKELGRVIRLSIDQLGYDDGIDVFVIEAEPDRALGLSIVTVLRPMVTA
jgi:hypothetical protein